MPRLRAKVSSLSTVERIDKVVRKTKEQQFFDYVDEMYREEAGQFRPIYPWVLVRVLPKTQAVGGIWLPENQNKVNYEGFVLCPYHPHDMMVKGIWRSIICKVRTGQRILFPHYVGMPVAFLDEKYYRVVKEEDILGILEASQDKRIKEVLHTLFDGAECVTTSGE